MKSLLMSKGVKNTHKRRSVERRHGSDACTELWWTTWRLWREKTGMLLVCLHVFEPCCIWTTPESEIRDLNQGSDGNIHTYSNEPHQQSVVLIEPNMPSLNTCTLLNFASKASKLIYCS